MHSPVEEMHYTCLCDPRVCMCDELEKGLIAFAHSIACIRVYLLATYVEHFVCILFAFVFSSHHGEEARSPYESRLEDVPRVP